MTASCRLVAPADAGIADRAAALRTALDISIADAHLGVVLAGLTGPHAVLTSDAPDVRRIAGHLGARTTVVRL